MAELMRIKAVGEIRKVPGPFDFYHRDGTREEGKSPVKERNPDDLVGRKIRVGSGILAVVTKVQQDDLGDHWIHVTYMDGLGKSRFRFDPSLKFDILPLDFEKPDLSGHDFSNPYLVNRLAKYTDGARSSPFRMCVNCGADDNSVSRARPCLPDPLWRKAHEQNITYATGLGDSYSQPRKPLPGDIPWMPYNHLVGGPTKL